MDYIASQFEEHQRTSLPEDFLVVINLLLINGYNEVQGERYTAAVEELSQKLSSGEIIRTVRERSVDGEITNIRVTSSIRDLIDALCPMWPFC